jgi:CMP/dCMP kinase
LNQQDHFDSESVVVTIDGPAGAGKSTVARLLARAIGFDFLDTGAMYRCVTHEVLRRGMDPADEQAVFDLAKNLHLVIEGNRASVDGRDVSDAIRAPEVGSNIGLIANNIRVRRLLSEWQRAWAKGRRLVTEGRDQGSEVFTDAACKIFLQASSKERARRRQAELANKGISMSLESVLEQQDKRDCEDSTRPVGALRKAEDSIEFSTDGLSLEAVVSQLEQIVRNRLQQTAAGNPGSSSPGSTSSGSSSSGSGNSPKSGPIEQ